MDTETFKAYIVRRQRGQVTSISVAPNTKLRMCVMKIVHIRVKYSIYVSVLVTPIPTHTPMSWFNTAKYLLVQLVVSF